MIYIYMVNYLEKRGNLFCCLKLSVTVITITDSFYQFNSSNLSKENKK